jgi:hypothetical protein
MHCSASGAPLGDVRRSHSACCRSVSGDRSVGLLSSRCYDQTMQVLQNAAWMAFDEAMEQMQSAIRLKQIREQPIVRGRATVSLFEVAPEGDRPHPRLRMTFTEIDDPSPPPLPQPQNWPDATAFRTWLAAALADGSMIAGLDKPPAESPHYWQNALRSGRITALLEHARAAIEAHGAWSSAERNAAKYALAELGALAYAGIIQFDDEDTGTYWSFLHDQPFVHGFERLRESLPKVGTQAFALLPADEQASIRRQDAQITNHLDFLMRQKYALHGITENDIERSLGGFLIDRKTRSIASEDPATYGSLEPRHEVLRIDPASQHQHAGAWVMRTPQGLALRDGTPVEVADDQLHHTSVPQPQLTFERAPDHPQLRPGVRFDWDGDGWADQQPLDWISWAGHCDVKAVLEQIGLTMLGQPSVQEYRSDTGQVSELSRDLLLELLAGVTELGSVYQRLDGSGVIQLGIHEFGGARNDSLPDRLQFTGLGQGQHFRWPISREREAMQVTKIEQQGVPIELDVAFARCIADVDAVDFSKNPRYLGTVDDDYNLIDATGMIVSADVRISSFDVKGQLVHENRPLTIDLRPETKGRTFLGTHLDDPSVRELYRVYLDHDQPAIVAELWRWDQGSGKEVHVQQEDITLPLSSPLTTKLSREEGIDDPASFQALIQLALHRGQNICADTDYEAPVWNGVVTRMQVERVAVNESARVERWRVHFVARFGEATLGFMVRRASDGTPEAYCPVVDNAQPTPDFLWQDLPDIASKGKESGSWVVNQAMLEREIVKVRPDAKEQGGWYVEDDHVKHVFELLYTALAGYQHTIVHQNKRYVFEDAAAWTAAREQLDALRGQLSFQ